jgi:hypothetical protein
MVYYRQHNAIEWEKAKWDAEVEVRKRAKGARQGHQNQKKCTHSEQDDGVEGRDRAESERLLQLGPV